jgi:hypothetical protein
MGYQQYDRINTALIAITVVLHDARILTRSHQQSLAVLSMLHSSIYYNNTYHMHSIHTAGGHFSWLLR